MPTLHRFTDRPGYYIKGVSNGKPVALGLTPEGEQYLTETLGLGDGGKFAGDTLRWLYKKKWAAPLAEPPPELPVVLGEPRAGVGVRSAPDAQQPVYDPNPVVFQGVVQVRLASVDHVALDASAEQVVRSLGQSGAAVLGPVPLPVHLETYTVIRDTGRKVYEVRFYQRLLQVRAPRRKTSEAMQDFHLPREVDVKVEMLP
jgi:small subunit ribosomal protein S10